MNISKYSNTVINIVIKCILVVISVIIFIILNKCVTLCLYIIVVFKVNVVLFSEEEWREKHTYL